MKQHLCSFSILLMMLSAVNSLCWFFTLTPNWIENKENKKYIYGFGPPSVNQDEDFHQVANIKQLLCCFYLYMQRWVLLYKVYVLPIVIYYDLCWMKTKNPFLSHINISKLCFSAILNQLQNIFITEYDVKNSLYFVMM